MDFTGKVAIVTGAGAGGIGEGIARGLAAAGAQVAVADINEDAGRKTVDLITGDRGTGFYVPVDISAPPSAEAMTCAVAERFGGIDYLVNNAALFGGMRLDSLMSMDWDYYNKFMSINIHGCYVVTKAAVPYMQKRGGGAIVNTSSTAAWSGYGAYSVAKLAVNGLTMALARELGPLNIRVNAIAPGPTDTPALRNPIVTEDFIAGMIAAMPIARLGQPADHAAAVSFLLSDGASWITGLTMNVDGGQGMRV
ncbi:SDR family oxidoreductase [Sphingosinicella soli]|uniref:3-oxoacyl-[acyl-carrier protein] reductase n=1 Tax=Sphingosinicella soli TaxID=333708 RepID=A0A7W7F7J8_9SPHN|nr:SDR family oxidoreductase [Sphingosinicella soli]MBB4632677.1 3-oxoacyl-[acyl-carrier protein] reductase [Sphingosinicella soli]